MKFKNGEYFEVSCNGALGRIIKQNDSTVWVEWQSFPGVAHRYEWKDLSGIWVATHKKFSASVPVENYFISEELLSSFEKMLNSCQHEFKEYKGLNHVDEYCLKCKITRSVSKK